LTFVVVIPARFASERLPGKPLLDLGGKTMIRRVYEQACASAATRVIVATDDVRIAEEVARFGGDCCMTSPSHPSGTDRLQEVCRACGFAGDQVVVNVQGDEPLIPPAVIDQVARNLVTHRVDMATLSEPIESVDDLEDPNIVKVVTDGSGRALYFSRAPIPWPRDEFARDPRRLPGAFVAQRHLGIYAYRVTLLDRFVGWQPAPIEQVEKLEQLRAMWHGVGIHVETAAANVPPGIDTAADLERARAHLTTSQE